MAVELSGGLDSSLIIEFMLRQEFPLSLVAFVSSRYEFRTERAVQAHYEEQCSSVCLIPYEECPAFGFLDKVPSHPFPAQESLFYARHLAAAKACVTLEVDLLLSGEAGDQLLGFAPDPCDFRGRAPKGYAYWNLAELWSDQYVYRPLGCSYVSGLALGRLPAMLLQARAGLGSDHMKIWARNKLRNHLPTMLTDYAYKAFHDGWVIDGLLAARSTIHKIADYSYNLIGHPALSPSLMLENSENYRHLSEEQRRQFLAMLSFATWAYSNRSEAL